MKFKYVEDFKGRHISVSEHGVSKDLRQPRKLEGDEMIKTFILGSKEAAEALFLEGWYVKDVTSKELVMAKHLA